jgi:hypothetical protein
VILGQNFPRIRLCGLHPGEDIGREERPRPVVWRIPMWESAARIFSRS